MKTVRDIIIETIKLHQPISNNSIAALTRLSKSTVHTHLKALDELGMVYAEEAEPEPGKCKAGFVYSWGEEPPPAPFVIPAPCPVLAAFFGLSPREPA